MWTVNEVYINLTIYIICQKCAYDYKHYTESARLIIHWRNFPGCEIDSTLTWVYVLLLQYSVALKQVLAAIYNFWTVNMFNKRPQTFCYAPLHTHSIQNSDTISLITQAYWSHKFLFSIFFPQIPHQLQTRALKRTYLHYLLRHCVGHI